jgi:hypothetical protein
MRTGCAFRENMIQVREKAGFVKNPAFFSWEEGGIILYYGVHA